jgi:hypothetical protein
MLFKQQNEWAEFIGSEDFESWQTETGLHGCHSLHGRNSCRLKLLDGGAELIVVEEKAMLEKKEDEGAHALELFVGQLLLLGFCPRCKKFLNKVHVFS